MKLRKPATTPPYDYSWLMDITELTNRFSYHAPPADSGKSPRYQAIRKAGLEFSQLLTEMCPPSRELSLAVTKVEEAVFWANAGVARRDSD